MGLSGKRWGICWHSLYAAKEAGRDLAHSLVDSFGLGREIAFAVLLTAKERTVKLELTPVTLVILACLAVVMVKGIPPETVAFAVIGVFMWSQARPLIPPR